MPTSHKILTNPTEDQECKALAEADATIRAWLTELLAKPDLQLSTASVLIGSLAPEGLAIYSLNHYALPAPKISVLCRVLADFTESCFLDMGHKIALIPVQTLEEALGDLQAEDPEPTPSAETL